MSFSWTIWGHAKVRQLNSHCYSSSDKQWTKLPRKSALPVLPSLLPLEALSRHRQCTRYNTASDQMNVLSVMILLNLSILKYFACTWFLPLSKAHQKNLLAVSHWERRQKWIFNTEVTPAVWGITVCSGMRCWHSLCCSVTEDNKDCDRSAAGHTFCQSYGGLFHTMLLIISFLQALWSTMAADMIL